MYHHAACCARHLHKAVPNGLPVRPAASWHHATSAVWGCLHAPCLYHAFLELHQGQMPILWLSAASVRQPAADCRWLVCMYTTCLCQYVLPFSELSCWPVATGTITRAVCKSCLCGFNTEQRQESCCISQLVIHAWAISSRR